MRPATTTVEPDAHVASAAWLMKRANDSALVVTSDDGRVPIAVITDADVSQAVADGRDLNDTRINQLHLQRPAARAAGDVGCGGGRPDAGAHDRTCRSWTTAGWWG